MYCASTCTFYILHVLNILNVAKAMITHATL